jgi:hypothetical protein
MLPIPLSEPQFFTILTAADVLPAPDRGPFLIDVAQGLVGQPVGDGSVARAVAQAFHRYFRPPEIPREADHERVSKLRNGAPIERDLSDGSGRRGRPQRR